MLLLFSNCCSLSIVVLLALPLAHCHFLLHYRSSHIATPCVAPFALHLSHCTFRATPFMLQLSCRSFYATPFTLFLACYSSHITLHTLFLLCCSFGYSPHVATPFPLLPFFCYYSSCAFQVHVNLASVVLLVLPLLFLSCCYFSSTIVLFCLVSMVLPLSLPCANQSSKLQDQLEHQKKNSNIFFHFLNVFLVAASFCFVLFLLSILFFFII